MGKAGQDAGHNQEGQAMTTEDINGAITLIQNALYNTQDKTVIEGIDTVLETLGVILELLDKVHPDDVDYSDPNDEHRLTSKQLGVVK